MFYSKEVQTVEDWTPHDTDDQQNNNNNKRHSKISDEELREQLRKEIEEDLRKIQSNAGDANKPLTSGLGVGSLLVREISEDEKAAITSSEDFLEFIERSSKVVERALDLDMEYDILADYGRGVDTEADAQSGKRIREVSQFYDERWSRKRMVMFILKD